MSTETMPKVSTKAVEMAGRNWLVAQLLIRGYEVSVPVVDRGIDLIVFREIGALGIRALPLQLKCAKEEGFNLDRKYDGRGIPLVYIWNVSPTQLPIFLRIKKPLSFLGSVRQGLHRGLSTALTPIRQFRRI